MIKEERLPKRSHRLLLLVLKYIPMLAAICCLLNTAFAAVGIDAWILSYIGGMSFLPWLFILIATYVFKFCSCHRMFLYYILVSNAISTVDYYIGIPLSTFNIIGLQFCVAGVFLFFILYAHVRHSKKTAEEDS